MSNPITRRALLAAAITTLLATAVAPFAISRAGSLARVDVYDRSAGESLAVYRHRGRSYVVGQPGNEYAVRIRNSTDRRLLAVVSVDGVNVVTGESASPDQSGYVLDPGDYVNIQGWRKDLDRTAAFYFSDPGDSYAARTGRPNDLGVIGVALFREREVDRPRWFGGDGGAAPPPPRAQTAPPAGAPAGTDAAVGSRAAEPSARRPTAKVMPEAAAQLPALGTGHGRREYSPAQQVEFERASPTPDELISIRYERRETLVAMGVLPEPRRWPWSRDPEPFPGAMGFVPDP
jgi:pyruvate/2-oxoglutarate dehydrogenase complex dihydrolipoamide acyltransferase (E2) component